MTETNGLGGRDAALEPAAAPILAQRVITAPTAAPSAPPAASASSPPQKTTVTTSPAPAASATPPDLDAVRAEAQRAERERIAGIDAAAEAARALLPPERITPIHTLATGNAPVFATGAARANKASTGTPLDTATIGVGRAAIMRQLSLDRLPIPMGQGVRLLVGPNQKLSARRATVPVAAT